MFFALDLVQFLREQLLLAQVISRRDRELEFFPRFRVANEFHQQVAANTGAQMVAGATVNCVHRSKLAFRRNRNRA
jgi:hypothetical protein